MSLPSRGVSAILSNQNDSKKAIIKVIETEVTRSLLNQK
jgi:hypothetical protein